MSNSNNDELSTSQNNEAVIDNLMISFRHAQSLVEFADSKASMLLIIHTIVLASAFPTFTFLLGRIPDKLTWTEDRGLMIGLGVLSLFSASIILSVVMASRVIYPRDAEDHESLFYYKTISGLGETEYYNRISQLTPKQKGLALAHQAFNISNIAADKMRRVRWSTNLIIVYLLALIFSIILLSFGGSV